MARNRKWIQLSILVVFLIIVAFTIWQSLSTIDRPIERSEELLNQAAPAFTASALDGKRYSIEELRGKAVVLNFWASWCAPCRNEMPLLNQKYLEHKQDGLIVLGLNIAENKQTIKGFVDQMKLQFPVLMDNQSEVEKKYGINPLPTTFFISRDGMVDSIHIGELDEQAIDRYIKKIL